MECSGVCGNKDFNSNYTNNLKLLAYSEAFILLDTKL